MDTPAHHHTQLDKKRERRIVCAIASSTMSPFLQWLRGRHHDIHNLLNEDPNSTWNAGGYAPVSVIFELARAEGLQAFAIQHDILNEFGGDSSNIVMRLLRFSSLVAGQRNTAKAATRLCRDFGWTLFMLEHNEEHTSYLRLDVLSATPKTWIALRRAVALFSQEDLQQFLSRLEGGAAVTVTVVSDPQKKQD